MILFFKSFFHAFVQSIKDFFVPATWLGFIRSLLTKDGIVLVLSYLVMGWLSSDIGKNPVFRISAIGLLGIITAPVWMRWIATGAARTVMARFPSLQERNWPSLSTIMFTIYPPLLMVMLATLILPFLIPNKINWLMWPILVVISAYLFSHPMFSFATCLCLTKEETRKALIKGTLNGARIDEFSERNLVLSAGLVFALCLGLSLGSVWLVDQIDGKSLLLDSLTTKSLLLDFTLSVAISILLGLVITNLYLPPLAAIFAADSAGITSGAAQAVSPQLCKALEPAVAVKKNLFASIGSAWRYFSLLVLLVAAVVAYGKRLELAHFYLKSTDNNYVLFFNQFNDRAVPIEDSLSHGMIGLSCRGAIKTVDWLMALGARFREADGARALNCAVARDRRHVLEFLISRGVNVDATHSLYYNSGYNVETALQVAAEKGNLSMVQFLLSKGANPNYQEPNTFSAIHFAAKEGHLDVIRELIKAGARGDISNPLPPAMLYVGAKSRIVPRDWRKILGEAKEAGLVLDAKTPDGQNLLHYVAVRGISDAVPVLIELGFSPNTPSKYGVFPFMYLVNYAVSQRVPSSAIEQALVALTAPVPDINVRSTDNPSGGIFHSFYRDWSVAKQSINNPWLHQLFADRIDFGRMEETGPLQGADFRSKEYAEAFIQRLESHQLRSLKSLHAALRARGWEDLAEKLNMRIQRGGDNRK